MRSKRAEVPQKIQVRFGQGRREQGEVFFAGKKGD